MEGQTSLTDGSTPPSSESHWPHLAGHIWEHDGKKRGKTAPALHPASVPYHDKNIDYIVLAVVNKGYQGENAYTAYVFDKELILNVISHFKQTKKLNKGKNIVKDEYNNKLNITSKRISLSQQFLSNAIYSFDNVYYAKTRDVLNGSYYDF